MENTCQYCLSIFKNLSNLKAHLIGSKKCLKSRGIKIESKYNCSGCDSIFMTKINLSVHKDSCKEYSILQYKKENEELCKINSFNCNHIKELNEKLNENILKLDQLQQKFNYSEDMIVKLYKINETNTIDHDEYIKLKVRYDDLEKQHEKTITKLEIKLNKYEAIVEGLAKDGMNKPTTTTNTVNNNNTIRNQLSSTYTLEKLESKKLEQTLREHYTERDFFNGQKGLANCCVEKIAKTPDGKMLICCSDMSRKKFKILDVNGNLKEDIEARLLCQKLKVPIQNITKEIYDKVIERIDAERDRLSTDDRSRREKLLDDTMRAQQVYIDNMNFDDLNYNQDFMHELCVLLNV